MFKILYLALAIFYLAIALYSILFFIVKKRFSKKIYHRFLFLAIIIGLVFLVKAILFSLSSFGAITLQIGDIYFINPILLLIITSALVFIFADLMENANLKYSLFLYFLIFFSFLFSGIFYSLFFFISHLLLILIFLLVFVKKDFKKVSISGWIYSLVSLLLFFLLEFGIGSILLFEFVTSFLFLIFLFYLFKVIEANAYGINLGKKIFRNSSLVLDFLRYFLFVILLMSLIFISTVTIHELGHFIVSKSFGCSLSRIIYSGGLPHTEVLCQNKNPIYLIYSILGGILLPFLIALIFFFVGGRFTKEIGLGIFGFNLLLIYQDLIDLGFSSTESLFFSILGLVLIILSVALLSNSRVEENSFLSLIKGEKAFYIKEG